MRIPISGVVASCALAVACATAACDRGDVATRTDKTAATANADDRDAKRPITLVGCLQKRDGIMGDYVLSDANRQSEPVGTSGASDAVGREQMHAAAHSYRLSGDNDKFKDLVGKQVRVSGTLVERSELARNERPDADKRPAGTSGSSDERAKADAKDRAKIDEDDLAKVDVTTIDKIADACSAANSAK